MKKFYQLRQNNSGGNFRGPAINVLIEADTPARAIELVSPHITLCGDSVCYADYDDCGCCPCCGHRWSAYFGEEPTGAQELIPYLFGKVSSIRGNIPDAALIKTDGTMVVGDTPLKIGEITEYMKL